jgi:hypothetical protein
MALPVGFAVGQGIKLLALGLALAARLRAAPS